MTTFCWKGKTYETERELANAAWDWNGQKVTAESMKDFMENLGTTLLININVHELEITNSQFSEVANELLIQGLRQLHKYVLEKKHGYPS